MALLGWKVSDLAEAWRLETAEGDEIGGRPATVEKLVGALEAAGIEFSNGDSPGVKLHTSKPRNGTGRKVAKRSPRDDNGFDAIGVFAPA